MDTCSFYKNIEAGNSRNFKNKLKNMPIVTFS